jgi:HEAT repeat protein
MAGLCLIVGFVVLVVRFLAFGPPPQQGHLGKPGEVPIVNLPALDAKRLPQLLEDLHAAGKRQAALQEMLKSSGDPSKRMVVETLMAVLGDSDENVPDLLRLTGRWGKDDDIPFLATYLDAGDAENRQGALDGIAELHSKQAMEKLIAIWGPAQNDPKVREAVRRVGAAAEPALLELLGHPDKNVVEKICALLGDVGTRTAMQRLESLARDRRTDFDVRFAANVALSELRRRHR